MRGARQRDEAAAGHGGVGGPAVGDRDRAVALAPGDQRRHALQQVEAVVGVDALAVDVDQAFAQAAELAPHGCTAVALTPGWLRSEMMLEAFGVTEANWRDAAAVQPHFAAISESPRYVGRAVAALAGDPELARRNGGSFSSGELAREYGFTDLDGSRPDCWRYMVEVQDAGRPADATGYR